MAFRQKDTQIYDELWVNITTTKTAGAGELTQNCFGFWLTGGVNGDETTFIYRMRQVEADKATGTGEEILAGDRLFYVVASGLVTPNSTGTPGVDFYFCGWAKKDADADDTKVLMNFDGTHYDFDDI